MNKTLRRIILLGTAFALGCTDASDSPLTPRQDPQLTTAGSLTEVSVLQRLTPLVNDISASAHIGKSGGTILIPEAGIKVVFPENALVPPSEQGTVAITVTALKGSDVAYRFEPHGLEFLVPVQIQQDAKVTEAWKNPNLNSSQGAYFPDGSHVDGNGGAKVSEFRSTDFDLNGSKFRWTVEHFSGYLLATNFAAH